MKKLVVIFIAFFLCRCAWAENVDTVVLSDAVKSDAVHLAPVETEFYTGFTGENSADFLMLVLNGSHLISINLGEPGKKEKILNIYEPGKDRPVYSALDYGKDDSEYLGVMPFLCGSTLYLTDIDKGKLIVMDLSKVIASKRYRPEVMDSHIDANAIIPYKGRLLCLSPLWTDRSDVSDKFMLSTDDCQDYAGDADVTETQFVARGSLLANSDVTRIFFFDEEYSVAELYDGDLNLLRRIVGPDGMDGGILEPMAPAYSMLTQCACADAAFVSYIGDGTPDMSGSYIFKFDWNGNLLETYVTDDMVYNMSVSPDGKTLYAYVMDAGGSCRLVKYIP